MMARLYLTSRDAVDRAEWRTAPAGRKVGPAHAYSIMRLAGMSNPPAVPALMPPKSVLMPALEAKRRGATSAELWPAYESALREAWADRGGRLAPGVLSWGDRSSGGAPWDGDRWVRRGVVESGATLYCACGVKAARDGYCHRNIAADLLDRAGWLVILDGAHFQRELLS